MKLIKNIDDKKIKTVAVDFDGTLCTRAPFPQIGAPKEDLIAWLIAQKCNGCELILWTCREGDALSAAIAWCADHGLVFDAVNENPPSCGLKTRKVVADLYIDDRACIPLHDPST